MRYMLSISLFLFAIYWFCFGQRVWALAGIDNSRVDPGYNVLNEIYDTQYEERWQEFVYSNNREYTDALKSYIDHEGDLQHVLVAGRWYAAAVALVTRMSDPVQSGPVILAIWLLRGRKRETG